MWSVQGLSSVISYKTASRLGYTASSSPGLGVLGECFCCLFEFFVCLLGILFVCFVIGWVFFVSQKSEIIYSLNGKFSLGLYVL